MDAFLSDVDTKKNSIHKLKTGTTIVDTKAVVLPEFLGDGTSPTPPPKPVPTPTPDPTPQPEPTPTPNPIPEPEQNPEPIVTEPSSDVVEEPTLLGSENNNGSQNGDTTIPSPKPSRPNGSSGNGRGGNSTTKPTPTTTGGSTTGGTTTGTTTTPTISTPQTPTETPKTEPLSPPKDDENTESQTGTTGDSSPLPLEPQSNESKTVTPSSNDNPQGKKESNWEAVRTRLENKGISPFELETTTTNDQQEKQAIALDKNTKISYDVIRNRQAVIHGVMPSTEGTTKQERLRVVIERSPDDNGNQGDGVDKYFKSTLKVYDDAILIYSCPVQSTADHPDLNKPNGPVGGTIPKGKYTCYPVSKSGSHEKPFHIVNEKLGVSQEDNYLLHGDVCAYGKYAGIKSDKHAYSAGCQIVSMDNYNALHGIVESYGFTFDTSYKDFENYSQSFTIQIK